MNNNLPVMLLKGLVLIPNQEVKLDINNKISKKIVMISSKNYNDELLIVCPKDQKEEVPEVTDLPFGKLRDPKELIFCSECSVPLSWSSLFKLLSYFQSSRYITLRNLR